IAQYSMDMAQVKAQSQAQVSMLKNVMELQEASMEQLLAGMGVGASLNVQA
ncbi:MAG: YjfB family protein, partial [Synergistaceae bacterium]|nr:YjfB family protein [Synergistaceae bacterium]